jgi:hypothetical protein
MKFDNTLWLVAAIAPSLIVYLLAAILGLVNLGKHKSAALFALLGGGMAGLVSVSAAVARELLWANQNANGGNVEGTLTLVRFITLGANVVEAVGMGMIVFAVFVGRKQVRRDDDDRSHRNRRDDRDDRDDGPTPRASRPRS